ncbi:uncharacterized protein F4822DRAFT_21062 [Hypoxylon trugodes]|uniref:uncharacterized protein n=1 Tax=Hypoxylon trugodes TaxID=326681 RepID=UPI00219333A3|nr:uncharacterized protein F4822DRAFT_21062 [Hypoxylon trugodes]KAI1393694.1 hypothetical protein F4822DRAFT_21062 [Hypoxylon trugodes]
MLHHPTNNQHLCFQDPYPNKMFCSACISSIATYQLIVFFFFSGSSSGGWGTPYSCSLGIRGGLPDLYLYTLEVIPRLTCNASILCLPCINYVRSQRGLPHKRISGFILQPGIHFELSCIAEW